MRSRAVILASSLALALGAVAGCGQDGESEQGAESAREPAPADAVAAAAQTTSERKTARIAFDGTMEMSGLSEPVNFTGEGAADFGVGASRLTLDMSEFAEAFGGGLGDPAGWRGDAVYAGDIIYMRLPALTKLLPGAKRWLRVDEGMLMEQGGTQFSAPDPVEFVEFLSAAGRDVEVLGEEEVRGVATTHYRATIAVDELPRAVDPEARAEVEAYARRLRQMGVEQIPLETWVDEEGVARRVSVEYANMQANGREASVAFSLELFDLGAAVSIDLPPKSQVSDFEALLRGVQK